MKAIEKRSRGSMDQVGGADQLRVRRLSRSRCQRGLLQRQPQVARFRGISRLRLCKPICRVQLLIRSRRRPSSARD